MRQQFGSFGSLPAPPLEQDDGDIDERAILADDFAKPTVRIIVGVFLASLFAFFAASPAFDAPGVWANSFRFDTAFVVVWGPLLVWTMSRLKLARALRIYLVLSLFIEPFGEAMFRQQGDGYWDTVLWPAAVAYYGTIKEWSGLPGASLPIFFFVTIGLLYRAVWGKKTADYWAPPKFARTLLLVFLGTVFALSAWGILHGGTVEGTFRQIVHLMQLPLIAMLFLYALRVPEDLSAVGTIFVVTALFRSLLVVYVYFGVCMPQGITERPGLPEWCTNHSDSVLFVVAILIVVTHAFEQRTKRAILRAVGVAAFILFAIVLNNRRLAFVSLSVAPAVIYLALKPSKRKRRVTTALVVGIPLVIGYILVGSEINSTSALVKPAKLVMSVLDQKDSSSLSRDIENENLIYTMSQSPLLSTGFGFNYQNSPNNPPVDLSDVFANYRLIAHNGVLWMWSWGGLVGFTLLWMIFPVAGTLALRAYRASYTPLERSAALSALGAIAICVVQVWGDQGLNGYMTPITFGVAFAIATRLAIRAS
ncbi:MAG: O-antigen ligase family protein [Labilithrix sp.]|nr:O-antigen ligase family protein [Labilithrix sp.]MCW5833847.1 O-antigen ligase family protein [Labilithrix sp.]